MEEAKNLPKKWAQSQILDFFQKKEGIDSSERQGRTSDETKRLPSDKRVVIDVSITSDKMVGEHSAIETSLRNQETVLFENDVLFGGPTKRDRK
ncbi:hypothetical protein QYM36_005655 [Artemia franciscana]|uniref:Uncharacterized protein n=1 Tax=Artemia franciscana TaxID=6661 RepID=A0AA88I1Q0_ARTSF|nr:hypothetical protein QYM36_005655 [Artemia franciscana]